MTTEAAAAVAEAERIIFAAMHRAFRNKHNIPAHPIGECWYHGCPSPS